VAGLVEHVELADGFADIPDHGASVGIRGELYTRLEFDALTDRTPRLAASNFPATPRIYLYVGAGLG
jgi:hypothetical protein